MSEMDCSLRNHPCLHDPITRYVLIEAKRRDVPVSAIFMSEHDVVHVGEQRHNSPVWWALLFGFVPDGL